MYTSGSVLAPHVDRHPLITSAIINVARDDASSTWPLEVYGHDGQATNITMEPGDLILYESHSVIHGRPFPLEGKEYANVFVHFEPVEDEFEAWSDSSPVGNDALVDGGDLEAHHMAARGDLQGLRRMDNESLKRRDGNNWMPCHEAARSGHVRVLEYLRGRGVDMKAETGKGRDVRWWAEKFEQRGVMEWLDGLEGGEEL